MSVGSDLGFGVYRGRNLWSWVKRLLNPLNYLALLLRLRVKNGRWLWVFWMVLVLQFRPQSVYRFSTMKLLPLKDGRLKKTSNPLDDFGIDWDRTSEVPQLGAVTVIMRGISFDRSLVDHLPGPIYAVNWQEKLDRQDVVYVTQDNQYLDGFVAKEMFPILYFESNGFDPQGNYIPSDTGLKRKEHLSDTRIKQVSMYWRGIIRDGRTVMPNGSGFTTMVALGLLAESIEVYGWDFYLTFAPARAGHWSSLFKGFINIGMESAWNHYIELFIYNWHYAYRFSQLPNFKNHGYLSGLEKHQGINDRLDRIFYEHPAIDGPGRKTTSGDRVPLR